MGTDAVAGCEEGGISRWKVEYSCIPLDAFHFPLLQAKAVRQDGLRKKRAPLQITCLSVFECYTKISVVRNCVLKRE